MCLHKVEQTGDGKPVCDCKDFIRLFECAHSIVYREKVNGENILNRELSALRVVKSKTGKKIGYKPREASGSGTAASSTKNTKRSRVCTQTHKHSDLRLSFCVSASVYLLSYMHDGTCMHKYTYTRMQHSCARVYCRACTHIIIILESTRLAYISRDLFLCMQVHIDLVPLPTGPLSALDTDEGIRAAFDVRISHINTKKLEQAREGQRVQVWWRDGTQVETKYKARVHKVTRSVKGSKHSEVHVVWEDNKGTITDDAPYSIPFRHLHWQLLLPGDDDYDEETGVCTLSASMHVVFAHRKNESVYACTAPLLQEHSASAKSDKTRSTNPAPQVVRIFVLCRVHCFDGVFRREDLLTFQSRHPDPHGKALSRYFATCILDHC